MKNRINLRWLAGLVVSGGLFLAGCGGGGSAPAPPPSTPSNPVPAITSLSPALVTAGTAAQTLTINGTGFLATSTVTFNGNNYTATYISATQLTISLAASDQATAGQYPVVVTNPTPGGGASNSVNFTVNNPAPAITSLSPSSTFPCDPVALLTLTGTNFMPGATVTYNGNAISATVVNTSTITLALSSADIATPGTPAIVVSNPAPGGGASNSAAFTISTPAGPALSGTTDLSAALHVYALNADGSNGARLCTGASDGSGNFSMTLDAAISTGVRLDASGGQVVYQTNPAVNYPQTSDETAIFDTVSASISGIALDPISSLVDSMTVGEIKAHNTAEPGTHSLANAKLCAFFQFSTGNGGCPALELTSSVTNDQTQREAAIQGWLTEGLSLNATSPDDIFAALDQDISDGMFNGWNGKTRVQLDQNYLAATAGTTDYLDSVVQWLQGPGASVLPAGAVPAVQSKLVQGVSASVMFLTPFANGLVGNASSGMAELAWQGGQYLFINDGTTQSIVVINITDPSAPKVINNWSFSSLNNVLGAGDTGGAAILAGNQAYPQLFVYSGGNAVGLLNAAKLITGNSATDTIQPDFQGTVTFTNGSGGGTQNTGGNALNGAVWDGCWLGCQMEMSTADGYAAFDLSTNTLDETHLYPVQDSSEAPAENFAADIPYGLVLGNGNLPGGDHSALIAGNKGGLQLVDYGTQTSYYLSDSMPNAANQFHTYFPNFPFASPLSDMIDGNAIEFGFHDIAVFTSEQQSGANSQVGFINFDAINETPASGGNLPTFSINANNYAELALSTANSVSVTGVAVDSDGATALFKGVAGSSMVIAGAIQSPAGLPVGIAWTGLSDWVFYNAANSAGAGLNGFQTQGDPHTLLAVSSLGSANAKTQGISYGYLMDAKGHALIQVDITGLLGMTRQGAAGSGDPAHEVSGDPGTTSDPTTGAPILTEITWP